MKASFWGIAFTVLCAIQPSQSSAFSLSDHTLITQQAVTEFNQCVPQAFSKDDLNTLDHSDLWEDLNLLNKWTWYSHYYRPFETLDFYWRSDSAVRVADLSSSSITLEVLGGILHYLQDAASPPHVIPVTHGLTDGFESYVLSNPALLAASKESTDCDKLLHSSLNRDPFLGLLAESGVGTLRLLSEFAIHARSESRSGEEGKVLLSSDFWRETPFDTSRGIRPFGQYGGLGNSFGQLKVVIEGITYQIPETEYDRIKVSHLRLGIEVSKKLLSYWWNNR